MHDQHNLHVIAYMQHAWEQGNETRAERVKVGEVFRGAMPEAIAKGYPRGGCGYQMFISGYLYALPKHILVRPDDNQIVDLQTP